MADKKIIKFSRKRNKKLAKKIYRIVRIPLAVLAVVFAVFLSARMLGEVAVSNISDAFRQIPYIFSHGSGYPCSVDAAGNIRAELIGDSPAVLGSGSLTVYSSSARKMNETQLSSADSKIVSKNGRALLYSNTSNTLNLSGKTESLGSLTVDSPVTVAALASNGSVAAAFSSEQAQSVLAVYNKRSKEIFRWNCSKEYISAVDLSRSGRTVAVSAVGAENAQIYSRFLIFDVKKSEPRVDIKVDGAMILRLAAPPARSSPFATIARSSMTRAAGSSLSLPTATAILYPPSATIRVTPLSAIRTAAAQRSMRRGYRLRVN